MKVRSPLSKKKRRSKIIIAALGVIAIGMIIPWLFSTMSAIVLYPVLATQEWLNYSSQFVPTLFREKKALHDEIADLKHQLVVAENSSLTYNRLSDENQWLRSMLGAGDTQRLAAAVIARPNELPYDLLQIDRGGKHGVEIGAPVFIGEDVVIGLVVHTAPEYSFVELISTPDFQATAYVAEANLVATIEGQGGGVARVRVPQGVPLRVGDHVFLPSIDPGVYGRIAHVENEPTQPEQYGYISPEIALSGLNFVSVGRLSQISKSTEEIDQNMLKQLKQVLLVTGITAPEAMSTTTATSSPVLEMNEVEVGNL